MHRCNLKCNITYIIQTESPALHLITTEDYSIHYRIYNLIRVIEYHSLILMH